MLARAAWHYVQSLRSYTYSRSDLEALQAKRLRRMMNVAFGTVPHYHTLLRSMGKTPSDFRRAADIRMLPILSRKEVIENGDSLISRTVTKGQVRGGSGTSGTTLMVAYDERFNDLTLALQGRRFVKFGMRPWDRLVSVWPPKKYWRTRPQGPKKGEPTTTAGEVRILPLLSRLTSRVRFLQSRQDDAAKDLKELGRLEPDFIMDRASHLTRMAEHLPKSGRGFDVKGLNCTGEGFTQAAARRIEDAYGGKVLNSYGSVEAGAAGAECVHQRGMHLNEDWALFEVLKDGEQVGPGDRGEIVVTVFANETMLLVRYATGDMVELADRERCDCGSSLVRVRRMLGRSSDWLRGQNGTYLSPFDIAEEIETRFGLKGYQLVQRDVDDFVLKTLNPDTDEGGLSGPLGSLLAELVGVKVKLAFAQQPREDLWLKSRPVTRSAR